MNSEGDLRVLKNIHGYMEDRFEPKSPLLLGYPDEGNPADRKDVGPSVEYQWIRSEYIKVKNFVGLNFWARGYYVSTVGRDEAQVRNYIREQEKEDRRLDQLKMFE